MSGAGRWTLKLNHGLPIEVDAMAEPEGTFTPFTWNDASDAERVEMLIWYARQLSQTLRDQAEFPGDHTTQAEIDAKRYAAHYVDMVIDDWGNKFCGWAKKNKPDWQWYR
jgi:hypothetical protein